MHGILDPARILDYPGRFLQIFEKDWIIIAILPHSREWIDLDRGIMNDAFYEDVIDAGFEKRK